MRDLELAMSLIEAVVKAVKLPVSVKTHLGLDDTLHNADELAKRAENASIAMITIHGRTRSQFCKGSANWSAIRDIKKAVNIPVIANGDIINSFSAQRALRLSLADGVMVRRGVQGKQWILAQIANKLFNSPRVTSPKGPCLSNIMSRHYEAMLSFSGKSTGSRVARKHLGWYMDAAFNNSNVRRQILTADTSCQVFRLIPEAFHSELSG